jgi:hypothetical protein
MKPAVRYASKNMVFVEILHREKYLVSIMLQPIYSTQNLKNVYRKNT